MTNSISRMMILCVGLPRSGKSTWAWKQAHEGAASGVAIVNGDAVRLALHGQRFIAQAEPMVHVITPLMAEALFLAGHSTVIVDECNITAKRRDRWFGLAMKLDIDVELKVFDTPPGECKRRAIATGQNDLLPVIDRMASQWDLTVPKSWQTEMP